MKQLILIFISALLLTGCSMVGDGPQACPDPGATENITLSFRMISSDIGNTRTGSKWLTRADNDGHDEVDSTWPQFEDRIDVNNFAFYIFLDNDAADNKPLVMKMTDIAGSSDPNNMITGAYGAYTITTVIPKNNLEELLGREIEPGGTNRLQFRIVVLANAAQGTDYNALAPADAVTAGEGKSATTLAVFMENANKLQFNLNSIYSPVSTDATIDGIYKGALPMFGMSTFSATEEELYKSRPEERINIGDIYMLRAVAKLVVVDNSEKNESGFPMITGITVRSRTDMINQLPYGAASYANGVQVHTPNPVDRSTGTSNVEYRLGYLNAATIATHFGYLPEQLMEYALPEIEITAQLDANRSETYNIPMTGSTDYPVNFGASIIRNHIYTLNINSIAVGTPAEITVNVQPWAESSLELDYTESVIIPPDGKLAWTPGTYSGTISANGEIVMNPWVTTETGETWSPLIGRFGIQSPVNAVWTANIITTEGAQGSFAFQDRNNPDEYGNPWTGTSISGIIDGKLVELEIVTIDPSPDQQNKAILQIVVTVGTGASSSVIEADLTPDNTSYKYFTLVQNAN